MYQAQIYFIALTLRVAHQAKLAASKVHGHGAYDNLNPRAQVLQFLTVDTKFARLHGTYMNGLEFFPLYASAVLACVAVDVDVEKLKKMCTTGLVLRLIYYAFYTTQHTKGGAALRSLAWCVSLAHTCQMFRVAALEHEENN